LCTVGDDRRNALGGLLLYTSRWISGLRCLAICHAADRPGPQTARKIRRRRDGQIVTTFVVRSLSSWRWQSDII
jgi:hypothetical protein